MENINESELSRLNDLTINEVKSFKIFSNFSDKEALEVVLTIKRFAEIIYCDYSKNNIDDESKT